jgi:hypothetical protein
MSQNAGGGGGELLVLSQPMLQLHTGAQINFIDLTLYLTYGSQLAMSAACYCETT